MNKLFFSGLFAGFLFAFLVIASFPVKVFAEDSAKDRVQIIEDDKSGVVRIVIDGQEVVRMDVDGLHVRKNIDYGGSITDIGQNGFDSHLNEDEGG